MATFKSIITVLSFILLSFSALAQPPRNNKPRPAVVKKDKPALPKLKTSLGTYSDSIITVSVDDALKLMQTPLVITDDKKAVYTINTYECLYKRKGVTEDEESGKVSPATSSVAQQFKTTPVSEIWIKTMTEQLKAGEEIWFYDIVVKNADGRFLFAPNIKLVVK
ncbi:MAG: hypothetical protein JST86_13860 [Bacteroidetes bacterium]|nr:hypothetical protein [Bacteroidota bacterium]